MKKNKPNISINPVIGIDLAPLNLPGKIIHINGVTILTLDKKIGSGQIKHQALDIGIDIVDFNINLFDKTRIPLNKLSLGNLQFLYCLDGNCEYSFVDKEESNNINQYQTAVAHCELNTPSTLIVKKDEPFILNVIFINKKEYFKKFDDEKNNLGENIKNLLKEISKKATYFHSGGLSLKIAEELKLVTDVENSNSISEKLSQKGHYYIILATQIEQFCNEANKNMNTSGLLKSELKRIVELSNYIITHPEIQHTIKSLGNMSRISPAKLQKGFKFLFDRTVTDFVRNVRLNKAVQLISATDMTISEIVYFVGLTSRSYFCKIFKKKYNCSPKEFKSKLDNRALL